MIKKMLGYFSKKAPETTDIFDILPQLKEWEENDTIIVDGISYRYKGPRGDCVWLMNTDNFCIMNFYPDMLKNYIRYPGHTH